MNNDARYPTPRHARLTGELRRRSFLPKLELSNKPTTRYEPFHKGRAAAAHPPGSAEQLHSVAVAVISDSTTELQL